MEPSEEVNILTVIKLLKLTYSGDSKAMQKEAEKRLALLEERNEFVTYLQQIICDMKQTGKGMMLSKTMSDRQQHSIFLSILKE